MSLQEFEERYPFEKIKNFSLKELLEMAITSEIGAREFYESLASNIEIKPLKEKISWLAEEERKHEELLRRIHSEMFSGEEIKTPKEHIGPELKPVAKKLQDVKDIIDLIRWAMKAEEMAAQFYEELEKLVEGEEKKKLMRYLSDMEKSHYYALRAEYELLLDWSMYSQMMHIGP
ncbi:ferritin family protein [Thermococcus barophilus]|uniref:Rubrerythrin n=1 Tax=Thermococcus barophilus (strain DSM 11836 / MP) TaxID=391623 RepID=F0LIY9_THEBM|nr:ferritin family protein [Thermococcus barophilus]ADT83335.1 rubrerythrin [Thermococcus barophilus MP]